MSQNNMENYRTALDGLLGQGVSRATRTLSTISEVEAATPEARPTTAAEPKLRLWDIPRSSYNGNPALTPTALAHSQWSHIIRPGIDSAIDATCGNGFDSIYMAKMLFSLDDSSDNTTMKSELVCVDIQEQACESTRDQLAQWMDPSTLEKHVQIVHSSHSPLPRPIDDSSVALVVWNLGYLPNSNEKELYTQMESTISSIVDAALMVRIGGMLSITSYPKTNPKENYAVHGLVEALALLSSKEHDWRQFVAELEPDSSGEYSVRDAVQAAVNTIVHRGDTKQTWRVFQHKVLGRPLSPILLTATRIK
jgi:Putative rRNA methylase